MKSTVDISNKNISKSICRYCGGIGYIFHKKKKCKYCSGSGIVLIQKD